MQDSVQDESFAEYQAIVQQSQLSDSLVLETVETKQGEEQQQRTGSVFNLDIQADLQTA